MILTLTIVALPVFTGCEGAAKNVAYNSWSKSYEEQIQANQAYLSKYPDGDYADVARQKLDAAYIKIARRDETIESYQNYLEQTQDGFYLDEAHAALAALGLPIPGAPEYSQPGKETFRIIIIEKYQNEKETNNYNLYLRCPPKSSPL